MAYQNIGLEIEGNVIIQFGYTIPELKRDFLEFIKSKNAKFIGDFTLVNYPEGDRIKGSRETIDDDGKEG